MARILISSAAVLLGAAALVGAGSLRAESGSAAGQQVFKSQCSICHSTKAHGGPSVGPSLFRVVGRKAGTEPGFDYSKAMKHAGLVWTEANLEKYIADPQKVVPGDKMPYTGLKDAAKRHELVEYLNTLK